MKTKQKWFVLLILMIALMSLNIHTVLADSITAVQTVRAGDVASYQIQINNEMDIDQVYQLAVTDLPDGMGVVFTHDGPQIDRLQVAAQTHDLVNVNITVPMETETGQYLGLVTATADNGMTLKFPLVVNVENTYAVKIVSHSLNASVFRGGEYAFDITAANSGAAPLTNVTLAMDSPAKWLVQLDPLVTARLDAGSEVVFHVRVTVPTSQTAVDQPVQLTIQSDQANSEPSEMVVRVQNNPNYLWGAGLLVAAAVAGVLIYFRIRGRR